MVCADLQNFDYGTCAYHSITFIDFMTRCPDRNVYSLIMKFRRHMRARPDVKAILTVENILKEFHNKVNISIFGGHFAGSVLF